MDGSWCIRKSAAVTGKDSDAEVTTEMAEVGDGDDGIGLLDEGGDWFGRRVGLRVGHAESDACPGDDDGDRDGESFKHDGHASYPRGQRSEEDQWRLAELTWEAINKKGRTQAEWASDIGKSRTHVRTLVKVFTKWQTSSHRPSFWDAYDSANQADVTTPEEARQFKEDVRASTAIHAASPDRRAAIAEELLDDPEVQERRSADPSTQKFDTLDASLDLTDLCRVFASG